MKSKNWVAVGASCLCASGIAYASQTVSDTYDALGRLTGTQTQGGTGSGTTQSFQYDPAGNRKQYQSLLQVTLSMKSSVVNLTTSGATLTVNVNNPSAGGAVTFSENGTTLGSAAAKLAWPHPSSCPLEADRLSCSALPLVYSSAA